MTIWADDPHYDDVTILLDFEGDDASTVFRDWIGTTWTASGNAKLTTSNPLRGVSSLLLDGSGDWITGVVPSAIGTGDFTIEADIYISSLASDGEIFAISDSVADLNSFNIVFEYKTTGKLRISIQAGSGGAVNLDATSSSVVFTAGNSYHVAFVADGGTGRGYVDGVQVVIGAISGTRYNQQSYCRIGWLSSSYPRAINGKVDNLRVTKACRYPGGTTFTPPISLPTWNRLSYVSLFTTAETNDAQGIATDGTHLWYSSSDYLYKYDKVGALITSRSVSGDSPTDKQQINGLYIKDGRLFATAAKFASDVGTSWVVEYDPTTLAWVQQWSLAGDWFAEGLAWHDGYWWVIFHANKVVAQYDSTFTLIDTHDLSLVITGSSGGYGAGTGYDGIAWYGQYLLVNIHDVYDQNYLDVYAWTGSAFTPLVRWARPHSDAHQGLAIDPGESGTMWAAGRNPGGTDGIIKLSLLGVGPGGGVSLLSPLEQWWNLRPGEVAVFDAMLQTWSISQDYYVVSLDQQYGLKLGVDAAQMWSDVPVCVGELDQPWGDAGALVAAMEQRWGNMAGLVAALEARWSSLGPVLAELINSWAITSASASNSLTQGWDLLLRDLLICQLAQTWWGDVDPTAQAQPAVTVKVYEAPAAGQQLNSTGTLLAVLSNVIGFNLEASLDQYAISGQFQLHSQSDFLLCEPGVTVTVEGAVSGAPIVLRVDSRSRNRSGIATDTYSVEVLSPAAWLDAPYAEPIDGEFSGMASAIAAQVIDGTLPMTWETVDWFIGEGVLTVENQTPLQIVRSLAGAVGGVLQSAADGTLRVVPRYSTSVVDWPAASGQSVNEASTVTASNDAFEYRPGYNRYRVSNDEGASDLLDIRFEVEEVSTHVKRIHAQIPGRDELVLTHTGGTWVTIESEGRTMLTVEEPEVVEIVQGEGRTSNTVATISSSTWKYVDLGTVGFESSGLITAAAAGESLLDLVYSYEEQIWKVSSPEIEKVQFILEVADV